MDTPSGVPTGAPTGAPARDEPLWRDALGERLRCARRERGEKLSETAGRAGISPQYLSEMERGVKEPSSEMIAAVAGALDLSLAELTLAVAERLLSTQITACVGASARAAYALAA
ncbi:helix-turn-helix domain-containing protein [Glycomyces buryatensis]|uniref:Helix-turn-helix transcriptional regulator n=1 Tax=Glycomyces buryatensis TaxID=2570927 RepID=A0A4V4HS99_9ACTN|nr:helix-turn-helix transcriptional regulator [Glycomyces buryatensis]